MNTKGGIMLKSSCRKNFGELTSRGSKKQAFTLAEVLITLGIIGVVAAMTIPTLIANTKSQQFRSQFKKTLSTLNQAALMSKAQYGFDYSGLNADCGGASDDPTVTRSMCALLNGTLSGYTYIGKPTVENFKMSNGLAYNYEEIMGAVLFAPNAIIYSLSDGSIVGFYPVMQDCTSPPGNVFDPDYWVFDKTACVGFIDVNGLAGPNKEVDCDNPNENGWGNEPCKVSNGKGMGDVFHVVFHGATIEPATKAGRAVLNSTK